MSEDKFDIKELLKELGDTITSEAKEVIEENEDTLKDLGQYGFYELMRRIAGGKEEQIDELLELKMLRKLSDEELLKVKSEKIEDLKEKAEMATKRRKIAKDLFTRVGKQVAGIIVQKMLFLI